jgi:hypothetical protein
MILLALCLLLTGCGATCEEKGGKRELQGYIYVWQSVGKGGYMQSHPYYVCVMKEKSE